MKFKVRYKIGNSKLTYTASTVLDAIYLFQSEKNRPPTLEELYPLCGKSHIEFMSAMEALHQKGVITLPKPSPIIVNMTLEPEYE